MSREYTFIQKNKIQTQKRCSAYATQTYIVPTLLSDVCKGRQRILEALQRFEETAAKLGGHQTNNLLLTEALLLQVVCLGFQLRQGASKCVGTATVSADDFRGLRTLAGGNLDTKCCSCPKTKLPDILNFVEWQVSRLSSIDGRNERNSAGSRVCHLF